MDLPKILVAIPMKNSKRFLEPLEHILLHLDYPRDKLSLSVLESDSDDGTWEAIQKWKEWEGKDFSKVFIRKHDFKYKLSWEDRHSPGKARERCTKIGFARDLVLKPLSDEDFVLMLDSDITNLSNNLPAMVSKDLPILCLIPLIYDKEKKLRIFNGEALRGSPFEVMALFESYPKDVRTTLYKLEDVSTTAVLIKSEVIHKGAKFEPPHKGEMMPEFHSWEQTWFAVRAKKLGYVPTLDPSFAVLHGARLATKEEAKEKIRKWVKDDITTRNVKGKIQVRTWNIPKDGEMLKVATIEQGLQKPSMCDGCPAPCSCRGSLRPVLNAEEFLTNKFPVTYDPLPDWLKAQGIKAKYLAVLDIKDDKCQFFDEKNRRCKLWPNLPMSCKSYDCREDTRPEIASFARRRAKKWRIEQRRKKMNGRNS